MKNTVNEFCTQMTVIISTIMLTLTGIIGIDITKYCLYAIVGLCLVKTFYLKIKPVHLLLFMLIFLSSLIIVLFYGGNYASYLIFITSISFALSVDRDGISKGTWKLVKICTYTVCLMFIFQMIAYSEYSKYGQLMLYFENPNMTGIALSAPAMNLVLMIADGKKKFHNIINWILLAVMMYMITLTQNRGSLLSLLIVIIFALLAIYPKKPLKVSAAWFFAVLKLTPIVVMFIYIALFMRIPNNVEFWGKPLFSGRESAWMVAISNMISEPFSHHVFEEGTLNLFLEGVARYGILAMIGYFSMLIAIGKKKREIKEMSAVGYVAYIAFHCCLLQQSFESTLLTGSYSIYIWSYLLLGIASMKLPTENNEKEKNEFIEGTRGI